MLEKKKEFVEEHAFKALKERNLKNMESRSKRPHGFSRDEMETVIKEVLISSKSNKLLS